MKGIIAAMAALGIMAATAMPVFACSAHSNQSVSYPQGHQSMASGQLPYTTTQTASSPAESATTSKTTTDSTD